MGNKLTDIEKHQITLMREQGETWKTIATKLGRGRSNLCTAFSKGFISTCRYVCSNCGGPTNSELKLCNKPDCRKLYACEQQRINRSFWIYGLSPEDVAQLILGQDNKCAICKKVLTKDRHIDHDHETGKVRGILCRQCNLGLGMLQENADLLYAAARYLEG